MNKIPAILCVVCAAAPAQELRPLEREGPYWVERSGGTIGAGDAPFLRIETRGAVIFQGDGGASLGYQLRRAVMAPDEAEARRLLAAGGVARPVRAGDQLGLALRAGDRRVISDVRVQPPRSLRQVVVETEGGPVEVRDVRAPVNVRSGGGPVLCDRIAGALSVRTGGGDLTIGDIQGSVRAWTGSGVVRLRRASGESWLESGGGEILVEEAGGALFASTGAGNVEVGRAGARVEARTRGGQIRVREAAGEVVAESAGGTILIGSARGVRCESAAGAVKLGSVTGEMRVVTAVGSILAELRAGLPLLNSLLSAAQGDITVWIPEKLAVTVAAVTGSARGAIVSEFPEIQVRKTALDGELRAVARGSLHGGGPVLRVSAGDGVVYLRKR